MMQQIPTRKKGDVGYMEVMQGIKSICIACGNKFNFVSASFASICNDCRKHHENQEFKKSDGGN